MATRAILIQPDDDVAVVTEDVAVGDAVRAEAASTAVEVAATMPIPAGHKVAVKPVAKGDPVHKYGEKIGLAIADISPGDHVHMHNLASDRVKID
jgi:hypothetical protein